jgi:hypothetical protein
MVEKIESGTRIVIQYNVYIDPTKVVTDKKKKTKKLQKHKPAVKRIRAEDATDKKEDENDTSSDQEEDNDDDEDGETYGPYLEDVEGVTKSVPFPQVSMAGIANVLALLDKKIDSSGTSNIAIPLFHRYSAASIKPEYLKLADQQLFNAIAKTGKYLLGLSPVTIDVVSDYEGGYDRSGYSASFTDPMKACYQWDTESNAMQESTIEKGHFLNRRKCHYIVSKCESSWCLEASSYKEYTGNEAEEGRYKYYVGVMVVCRK